MYLILKNFTDGGGALYFTTREGGESLRPFDTLNLGLHTGDKPARVYANRRKLLRDFNLELSAVKTVCQVHGAEIAVVDADSSCSWAAPFTDLPEADGLITAAEGVSLSVFLADCMAVYIYDPIRSIRTLLHAGWRSVHQKIIGTAISIMRDSFGSLPQNCQALISPGLRCCCFEIQPQSFPVTEAEWQAAKIFQLREGKYFFDLAGVIKQHLLLSGIPLENITESKLCTACDPRFFSYRHEGKTGRMAALWL